MACFKFEPPQGYTLSEVLRTAHDMRVAAGDYAIEDKHLADAIAELTERRLSKLKEA
jgi:glyoxalase family protein